MNEDARRAAELELDVARLRRELAEVREAEQRFSKIFEHSHDAIFVFDPATDRILDANPRACAMLGYSRDELLAIAVSSVQPGEMPRLERSARVVSEQGHGWTRELTCLTRSGERLPTEISASAVKLGGKHCIVAMVRDVSERRQADLQRENLIAELRDALAKVKTLSGLLPICAACKKIRDAQGNWCSLESYIAERSDAEFTHGLCAECAEQLYPEAPSGND